mgnify:CR=1 FL=1
MLKTTKKSTISKANNDKINKYIFDLDLTLYSDKDYKDTQNYEEYYSSFTPKYLLSDLLKILKGNKYILTNANMAHANDVLDRLFLKNIFTDIIASDIAGDEYKPSPDIYHIAFHEFKINDDDNVYFFEDSLENLRAGKKYYNWKGVLIDPSRKTKPKTADYMFKTIEDAIIFFIGKEKFD